MDPTKPWYRSKKFLAFLTVLTIFPLEQTLTIWGAEPLDGDVLVRLAGAIEYGLPALLLAYGGTEYAKAKNGQRKLEPAAEA